MHIPPQTLVTGFGPFPGVDTNPTEQLINHIRDSDLHNATRHLTLPVSFSQVLTDLITSVDTYSPTKILHLGVATDANKIRVETRAYNHIKARVPDIEGRQPRNARVTSTRPKAESLAGSLNAVPITALLNDHGFPAEVSTDAGRYVCNALFYSSLLRFAPACEVSFIHIPAVDTALPESSTTRWNIESFVRALELILVAL